MPKRIHERKPFRFLFVLLYTVAGALVLLEVFLRMFDPIGIVYYFDTARYFKAMRPDPDFGYIHTPDYRARLQGVDVAINSEGLRSPPFEVTKPAGEKRLMILGDSVVFGWGARQDSIFPALIQRRLAERDDSWRVIAAGVGSWNTRAEYEFLKKRGVNYDIDVLLLVVVANDVEVSAAGASAVVPDEPVEAPRVSIAHRLVRGLAKHSYAVGTFYHVLKQRNTSTTLTDLYRSDSAAWRDARSALDGIVEICRGMEIPVVVFLYGDFKSEFSKAFYSAYRGHLAGHDVPVHVFAEEVYDKRYRNSIVDGHANPAAHRLIADELYRALEPLL
jgi:lysophospholipase L1-like esterase